MTALALLALLAASSGCASSGAKAAPQSAPGYAVATGADMRSMDVDDSDSDGIGDEEDLMLETESEARPEPAEPGGGSGDYLPPPPPPAAEARYAQNVPPADKPADRSASSPIDASRASVDVPKATVDEKAPDGTSTKLAGPLLIYTATIYMAVFEVQKAIAATQKLATELGGYLVRRDDRTITVRVPAKKFRAALASIGEQGDVLHHEENVQDVTDQFFDLKVRLKNSYAMQQRLTELLKQAKNVEEALMVERELERVTEQIERFEGKLKLMRELISFSTITVEFKPRPVDRINSNVRLPFHWINQLGLSQLLSL